MLAKLLGIGELDFTTTTGEHIQGNNVFVSYPDENIIGERTDRFFVKSDVGFPEQLKIGDQINIAFNRKGKVESISKK